MKITGLGKKDPVHLVLDILKKPLKGHSSKKLMANDVIRGEQIAWVFFPEAY